MTRHYPWLDLTIMAIGIAVMPPMAASAQVAPNIRYVDYNPDTIIRLTGHTGYQMMLEFEPGEQIETVGIGDSSGWQVTPNGAGTVMFLKPIGVPPATNLSIITNFRRYNFELLAKSGLRVPQSQIIYAVRFRYPQKVMAADAMATPPPLITNCGTAPIAMTAQRPMCPNRYLTMAKRPISALRLVRRRLQFSALRLMPAKASSTSLCAALTPWWNKSRRNLCCVMGKKSPSSLTTLMPCRRLAQMPPSHVRQRKNADFLVANPGRQSREHI
jgi:hypothetical protein